MLHAPVVPRGKMHRLFLALLPDPATAARIAALAHDLRRARRFTGRPLVPERLHVSLFFLGSWDHVPERIVARTMAAAGSVKALPFTLTFDRSASFSPAAAQHPFVLLGTSPALMALREALAAAMTAQRLGTLVRGAFTPHMTLLYDARLADEAPIAPLSWTVRDIALVHSLYGQSRHEHLARWPLGAD